MFYYMLIQKKKIIMRYAQVNSFIILYEFKKAT